MTVVQAWVLVYVDGKQVASKQAGSEHIPSMLTADKIAATTLRAARLAVGLIESTYPETEENEKEGSPANG
jgi:hypothetical protein